MSDARPYGFLTPALELLLRGTEERQALTERMVAALERESLEAATAKLMAQVDHHAGNHGRRYGAA
jgi:hypothetical protein